MEQHKGKRKRHGRGERERWRERERWVQGEADDDRMIEKEGRMQEIGKRRGKKSIFQRK